MSGELRTHSTDHNDVEQITVTGTTNYDYENIIDAFMSTTCVDETNSCADQPLVNNIPGLEWYGTCQELKWLCNDESYKQFMITECPLTCGHCCRVQKGPYWSKCGVMSDNSGVVVEMIKAVNII